jgi:hypothetical protein
MAASMDAVASVGLYVEFLDPRGNCLGQAWFEDWQRGALPATGDEFACAAHASSGGMPRPLSGCVQRRQFEVQRDEAGNMQLLVRMIVLAGKASPRSVLRAAEPFSRN